MMQESLRLWRAENLKERHSIGGKLWILMPVLTFLLAYGISQQNGVSSAYNWWYTTMLPGMTALAACLHGEKDKSFRSGRRFAFRRLRKSCGTRKWQFA